MTVKMRVTGGGILGAGGTMLPIIADKGDKGDPGSASTVAGPSGNAGWTPILAGEADGTRTLIKVADWTGGEGTKPGTGMYIGTAGYVATRAEAFNFNAIKRVVPASGLTAANGIATINLTAFKFASPPAVVVLPATTAVLNGATQSTIVAGSATKDSVQIKVEQRALLTGVLSLLAGATANVLLIEQ